MESILLKLKVMINDFIYEMIDVVFSYSDTALETFKYIAFIGVLIKIIYNFYNNPTDWWGYISWLPLTLLLFHYDALVIGLFDWSKSLDGQLAVSQNYDKAKHFFDITEIKYEESSMWDIGMTLFVDLFKKAFLEAMVSFLLLICFIISTIAFMYLKIKMFFKLLILTLFGPLNISMSFLNDFRGNYIAWLTKLIEVCTYIPLIYFIDLIGVEMLNRVFTPKLITSGTAVVETLTRQIVGIIFFTGIITLYFSVPSLVKYVITQGTSAVGTGKKVAAVAMIAARKIMTGGV